MPDEIKTRVKHIGEAIANVAEAVAEDNPFGAAMHGLGIVDPGLDKNNAGISLAELYVTQKTGDYKLNAGASLSASYNPFDNEGTAEASAHIGVELPYQDGKVLVNVSGEYDLRDGAKASVHGGYTEHDPNERVHTWTVDGYIGLSTTGELQAAIRGEVEMEVYKSNDGRLTSVYGRVALGESTTYGPGASAEVGIQREIDVPVFGAAWLRAGVGYNTGENNYNDTSSVGRVEGDLNTGSDNEGPYGKIGITFKF